MTLSNWNRQGFRNPYAQMASSLPGWPTKGLSAGVEPSLLIRRIFRADCSGPVRSGRDRCHPPRNRACRPAQSGCSAHMQQLRRRGRSEQLEWSIRADILIRAEPNQVIQQVVAV